MDDNYWEKLATEWANRPPLISTADPPLETNVNTTPTSDTTYPPSINNRDTNTRHIKQHNTQYTTPTHNRTHNIIEGTLFNGNSTLSHNMNAGATHMGPPSNNVHPRGVQSQQNSPINTPPPPNPMRYQRSFPVNQNPMYTQTHPFSTHNNFMLPNSHVGFVGTNEGPQMIDKPVHQMTPRMIRPSPYPRYTNQPDMGIPPPPPPPVPPPIQINTPTIAPPNAPPPPSMEAPNNLSSRLLNPQPSGAPPHTPPPSNQIYQTTNDLPFPCTPPYPPTMQLPPFNELENPYLSHPQYHTLEHSSVSTPLMNTELSSSSPPSTLTAPPDVPPTLQSGDLIPPNPHAVPPINPTLYPPYNFLMHQPFHSNPPLNTLPLYQCEVVPTNRNNFNQFNEFNVDTSNQKMIPQWLREAIQQQEKKKEQNQMIEAEEAEEDQLLTPSDDEVPKEMSTADVATQQLDTSNIDESEIPLDLQTKKVVTTILLSVTDAIFHEVAREALSMSRRKYIAEQQSKLDRGPIVLKIQKPTPKSTTPTNTVKETLNETHGESLEVLNETKVVGANSLGDVFTNSEHEEDLHSGYTKEINSETITQKVEAVEDEIEGAAFLNLEAISTGLYKPPEAASTPPLDTFTLYIYAKGNNIASFQMNSSHLIFGSATKYANVVDTHASVYSQHVALVYISKHFYVFPLGGETTILENSKVLPKEELSIEHSLETGRTMEDTKIGGIDGSCVDEWSTYDGLRIYEGGKRIALTDTMSTFALGESHRLYYLDLSTKPSKNGINKKKENHQSIDEGVEAISPISAVDLVEDDMGGSATKNDGGNQSVTVGSSTPACGESSRGIRSKRDAFDEVEGARSSSHRHRTSRSTSPRRKEVYRKNSIHSKYEVVARHSTNYSRRYSPARPFDRDRQRTSHTDQPTGVRRRDREKVEPRRIEGRHRRSSSPSYSKRSRK